MFIIGDKIAHPLHGAGIIEGISEQKIAGVTREYYLLSMRGGMTVLIPIDGCAAVGVRHICAACDADELLASIPSIITDMTQNWNRRYRENMLKIKSGDLFEVATVVKGLHERELERGLSTGERKMLQSAKYILVSELALALSKAHEAVEEELLAAFA